MESDDVSAQTEDRLNDEQLAQIAAMNDDGGEPEPEPDDDEETEAEPTPEPSDLAALEGLSRKLTSEAKRHENALAKLRVDDWDAHVMCPLCIGDGYLLPIPPGQQPDEIWEAIKALSGRTNEGGLRLSKYAVLCDDCDGYGEVLTGAHTMQGAQIPCELCKAKGWYDPSDPMSFHRRQVTTLAPAPQLAVVPGGPQNVPIDGQQYTPPEGWTAGNNVGGNDAWGRWQGHPRYGIDTQYTGGTW